MSKSSSCYALGGVINLGYIRLRRRMRSKSKAVCMLEIYEGERNVFLLHVRSMGGSTRQKCEGYHWSICDQNSVTLFE